MADRREYDYATRTLAEQLYVFRSRTYEEISREMGISEAQLKRWGKSGEWRAKREQYLTGKAQGVTRMIGIRDRIMEKLEAEIQPATVHQLLAGLRQTDSMIEARLNPAGESVDRPAIFLEDLRFIVEILKGINPSAVGIIAEHYDALIEAFKERYAQAT